MEKAEHNYGIDVARIVAMLMVLFLHVLGQGGVYPYAGVAEVLEAHPHNYSAAWLLETAAFGAVDLFALVSGYVGYKSKVRTGKYLHTWVIVSFWGIMMTLAIAHFPVVFEWLNNCIAAVIPGIENTFNEVTITSDSYVSAAFPLCNSQYWYFTAYTLMYFASPMINCAIDKLEKGELIRLNIAAITLLSVIPTFCNADLFSTGYGYTGLWLIAMYLLGGTLRKYPPKWKLPRAVYLLVYIISTLCAWSWFEAINLLVAKYPENTYLPNIMNTTIQYTSPFIVLGAVCILLFTVNKNVHGIVSQKVLTFIAPATFAVYIIHVQPLFWQYFMLWRFKGIAYLSTVELVFYVCVAVVLLFTLCILLERLRMLIFKLTRIDKLIDLLGSLVDKLLYKITE